MAHQREHSWIGDDVSGIGDADFRLRLVVIGNEDEIVAQGFERFARLLHR